MLRTKPSAKGWWSSGRFLSDRIWGQRPVPLPKRFIVNVDIFRFNPIQGGHEAFYLKLSDFVLAGHFLLNFKHRRVYVTPTSTEYKPIHLAGVYVVYRYLGKVVSPGRLYSQQVISVRHQCVSNYIPSEILGRSRSTCRLRFWSIYNHEWATGPTSANILHVRIYAHVYLGLRMFRSMIMLYWLPVLAHQ